jgi:steroid delta-isomerase-like uncharacterized protein
MSESVSKDRLARRVRYLEAHIEAENNHDVEAIMSTFAASGVLVFNGMTIDDHDRIRTLHEELGFGDQGGFSELSIEERARYISEEAIILEQVVKGRHKGTWQGVPATGRKVELAVSTVYKFDEEGKLSSENVYFDTGGLLKQLGVI